MEKKLKHLFQKRIYDIFIIRHPEVENYQQNIFNGTNDVDLSKRGYLQAENLYKYFKDKNIELVISSPMKRCKIVAEKFKNKIPVVYDERLKERNFGIFEKLSWQIVEKLYPQEAALFLRKPFTYRVRNGESFFDVKTRIEPLLQEILHGGKNTLIVAHGGINRAAISYLLDMKDDAILKISQDYASVNLFQTDGHFVLCKFLNKEI